MPRLAELGAAPRARFGDPEATIRTFAAALRAARIAKAIECFAPDSCFVTPDATEVSGREGIGGVLAQLVDQRAEIVVDPAGVLIAGDVAFVSQRWQLTVGNATNRHKQEVTPLLVLRRVGREWKLAIVAPWGRP
ncbi:MAG: nuclear transport factor 2 family protein [Solirubrobacterales bacterium]